MRARRAAVAGSAIFAVAMFVASAAWACTVFVSSVSASPNSGPELATVMVQGDGLGATPGVARSVELRWEGSPNQVLATVPVDETGRFSAEVRVPSASAGVHSIVAVADGAGAGRTVFEITTPLSPAGSSAATDATSNLWAEDTNPASVSTGSSSSLTTTAGAALLATGLVVLAGGFTVAGVRRRRASAN